MSKYGEYNADGSVMTEATECILTGRAVTPGSSVRERVPGTAKFYRVAAGQYDRVTDALREQWRAEAQPITVATEPVASETPAPFPPRGKKKEEGEA